MLKGKAMVKAVTPIPFVKARFFDRCGKPLSGGKVYTYFANTTTQKVTYKDPYGLTPNTNPIILDAAGEADIYLDGTYRIRVNDAKDVLVNDVEKIGSWFSGSLQDGLDNISLAMDDAIKPKLAAFDGLIADTKNNADVQLADLQTAINTAYQYGAGKNGWTTDLVVEDGKTQKQINDKQKLKNAERLSIKDFGAIGGSANDTTSITNAINATSKLLFSTDKSIVRQVIVSKPMQISGNTELVQDTPNQHTLTLGYALGTSNEANGDLISGMSVTGIKFGAMPDATADDFAALSVSSGQGAVSCTNRFENTENALLFTVSDSKWAVAGYGSKDSLSLGDYVYKAKRFVVQNIQASYTKIIGLAAHNNGDNTTPPPGGTNNGGFNGGIRLAGISKGNIVSASNIRDRSTAVEFQIGSNYNIVNGSYFENTKATAVNVNTLQSFGGSHNISGVTIKNAGDNGLRLQYLSHTRFDGLIDTTGVTTSSTGIGIQSARQIANDETFAIEFSNGSGTVPAVGAAITQGAVTGVLIAVYADSLAAIASNSAIPTTGVIYVKSVSGGFFKSGALTGINATATRAYATEGRNRIDATVSNAKSYSALIDTDSNLVDLISADNPSFDADIKSKYNIVRVVVADNPSNNYTYVSGSNNIVLITDNAKVQKATVLISGSNNIVIANTSAKISITGSNNYCDLICSRLDISGADNDIGGQIGVVVDNGTGNKYNRLKKGQSSGKLDVTTNANGEFLINHGLANAAKSLVVSVVGSSELLFLTISNIANSTSSSLVKAWTSAGAAAPNKSLTVSYVASL